MFNLRLLIFLLIIPFLFNGPTLIKEPARSHSQSLQIINTDQGASLLRSYTSKYKLAEADTKKDNANATLVEIEAKTVDKRAQILQSYLAQYNSPLQHHAQDFVEAADTYNLDWRLVAAISGVESTFGKFIPGGRDTRYTSYNAWGWGVYGTNVIYFKSWKDGIFTVSRGLRENYLNRGLSDPYSINRVYAANPHWGSRVSYFLQDIEKFKSKNESKLSMNIDKTTISQLMVNGLINQTAGASAVLSKYN